MKVISRPDIVRAIFRLRPEDKEVSIENISLDAIKHVRGKINLGDEEFVSRFKRSLFSDLRTYDLDHLDFGGIPTFQYIERSLRVRWLTEDVADRRRLQKLRNRALAINWIESLKDDRHYEFLGALLMQKLGATRIHITPPGNEFGIDFLAIVPAFSRSRLFLSGGRGVRIVGQAKYYKSAVAREKIQSFNDCMTSIRNNREELTRIVPAWFRNCPAPLMGCFVAHSGYQIGARVNAAQNGHILLDTRAASEILVTIGRLDHLKEPAALALHLNQELEAVAKAL